MKKLIRIISVILSVAFSCVLFCGCDALDELKASHGKYLENGNILIEDTEYKLLPECEELSPDFWLYETYIHLTQPDVPVLLSVFASDYGFLTKDKAFLRIADESVDYYSSEYIEAYYCALDRYEEVCDKINNGYILDSYRYRYTFYGSDGYQQGYHIFTQEEKEAFEEVLSMPATAEGDAVYSLPYEYAAYYIELCSNDGLFGRETYYSIYATEAGYYVSETDPFEYTDTAYSVPTELIPVFDGIMKEAKMEYAEYDYEYTY